MSTIPDFDPSKYKAPPAAGDPLGDRRDGAVYDYTPQIILAVRVALATGRPLLVRGPSGGGKSSLARHVARVLGFDFIDQVITSRTQAQDLLWAVDHIRRLRDAHAGGTLRPMDAYVHPGVLWRAFDPSGARQQAARAAEADLSPADGAAPADPPAAAVDAVDPPPSEGPPRRAVVLLDEIDKADPDVPNNLLVALGSLQFQVGDLRGTPTVRVGRERAPLVILTTNNERDLPAAFLRRCVELRLPLPDRARFITIGGMHFGNKLTSLVTRVAEMLVPDPLPADTSEAAAVSIAEFLDTVRACVELKVEPNSPTWNEVVKITVWKHGRAPVHG